MRRTSILFLFVLLLFGYSANSQSKIGLAAGFSFVDIAHAGVDFYVTPQSNVRLSIGTGPVDDFSEGDRWRTLSLDGFYHFGWTPLKGNVKPLYVRLGYSELRQQNTRRIYDYSFAYLAVGMDVNLTSKLGFNGGIGMNRTLSEKVYHKQYVESNWDYGKESIPNWIPRLELEFYYRF